MMSWIWCILFFLGSVCTTAFYGGDAALKALLKGAENSVTLCITLLGIYMLWMGLLNVAADAGLIRALSGKLKKPCEWLFPGAGEATGAITLNIAANMLGMGNVATPFGLEAMKQMQKKNNKKDVATTAMCCFLAVNASALEIIPTTMISIRASNNSISPAAIILPTFISSALATVIAIVLCKILARK